MSRPCAPLALRRFHEGHRSDGTMILGGTSMSRWAMLRRVLWLAPIVLPVTMLAAQQSRATRWLESCRDRRWRDYVAFCETRELTLPVTKSLSIDGRQN